jgi:sugar phosphate isomerase/epimerase
MEVFMFKIAINLYSLKDYEDEGIDEIFEKVSKAGYQGVETYSFYGLTAKELKSKFDKAGLFCPSMHIGYGQFTADIDNVINDAKTLGASYVVIPMTRAKTEAEVLEISDFICANAKKIEESGLIWLYHNHAHEFEKLDKGRDFFEVLLENTDSKQINLQVDTYWVMQGGADIGGFIEKYNSRIAAFHFKDHREVGAGEIDFPLVIKTAKNLGHDWLVVEQEAYDGDPYDSIRAGYDYLRKIEI